MPAVPTNFAFVPMDPAPSGSGPSPPSSLVSFAKAVLRAWQLLTSIVNGQLTFGDGTNLDNIGGFWANVADTGLANTDFVITHNLGRVPAGFITFAASIATDLYTGSAVATKTTITLRSSVAHAAVRLFVT
jgi:hypothetical protein